MARLVKVKATTRYCACPSHVPRDCRFTATDNCPYGGFPNGRFLWADQYKDIDTGEVVERTETDEVVEDTEEE